MSSSRSFESRLLGKGQSWSVALSVCGIPYCTAYSRSIRKKLAHNLFLISALNGVMLPKRHGFRCDPVANAILMVIPMMLQRLSGDSVSAHPMNLESISRQSVWNRAIRGFRSASIPKRNISTVRVICFAFDLLTVSRSMATAITRRTSDMKIG